MKKYTSKKICSGLYEIVVLSNGRKFEVEDLDQHADTEVGGWMLYEMVEASWGGEEREFWNDFATKRDAIASAIAGSEEGN